MTQGEKDVLDNLYGYFFDKFGKEKALKYLYKQISKMCREGDLRYSIKGDFTAIIEVKSDDTISEVTKKVKIIKLMRLFIERDAIAADQEKLMQKQRPTYRSSC